MLIIIHFVPTQITAYQLPNHNFLQLERKGGPWIGTLTPLELKQDHKNKTQNTLKQ